eukprot:CAMPEP_0113938796 /NCGR_PEP_ID=MMETSP1339-20121228/5226_1 /TAXON_ID=94617 /ORGANISM="Fibrocapsa japonica" /LENGTH=162 /DNA_ID=CAMNT_0000942081 /DNA_START=99 /DNA_END=587 /DNA_ORIENTATION=- /assembly_acc=CAM_ASM_000762
MIGPAAKKQRTSSGDENDLAREVQKVRKSIRGQIKRRLRSKKSKMKFEIPMVSLEVFAALVQKNVNDLPAKKGAYYPLQHVLPKQLLPGVFEPNIPEKDRLWYNVKGHPDAPEYCKTTYGHPKSLVVDRECEVRYKPSTKQLSVTCWSTELFKDWELYYSTA